MLDLGRRGPGFSMRQDSQNQILVEEKRKTVKLAFGSVGHASGSDDNEDDKSALIEEADEVQLEIKSGMSSLTEEDKRKTIKLEFGLPQRQLTIRDRSKTVELNFNQKEHEEEDKEEGQQVNEQKIIESLDTELDEQDRVQNDIDNVHMFDEVQYDNDAGPIKRNEDVEVELNEDPNQDIEEEMEELNKDIVFSDTREDNSGYIYSGMDDIHKDDLFDVEDKATEINTILESEVYQNIDSTLELPTPNPANQHVLIQQTPFNIDNTKNNINNQVDYVDNIIEPSPTVEHTQSYINQDEDHTGIFIHGVCIY
jgi:hypothetical protein